MHKPIQRVAIRVSTYRGVNGFLVYGIGGGAWPKPRVFTETRESAEKIKARLKAGEDITLEDFRL